MGVLMVLLFIAVATALPQGYNYQQPGTSFSGTSSQTSPGFQYESSVSAPSYSHQGSNVGLGHAGATLAIPANYGDSAASVPSYSGTGSSYQGNGLSASSHSISGGGAPDFTGSSPAEEIVGTITKNFYTHSAPEETEDDIQSDSESTGPTNKKYNIVFVKSGGQSATSAALALRKAQSNEKTLIYVLNKQLDPSELANALHSSSSLASNSPQVAFIKYKTPEEAAQAQQQIQEQYESLGGGPSFVGEEEISPVSSVVGSLGGSGGHGGTFGQGGHSSHGGTFGHAGHSGQTASFGHDGHSGHTGSLGHNAHPVHTAGFGHSGHGGVSGHTASGSSYLPPMSGSSYLPPIFY